LRACPAAPSAARPPDDGLVEAEIAAFDGFWQGRSLAEMHPQGGEIGASRAGQWRFCRHQDVPLRSRFLLPGIAANERVAGFIHIGHTDDPREGRARLLLAAIVTRF
jgi:hypothetical protein